MLSPFFSAAKSSELESRWCPDGCLDARFFKYFRVSGDKVASMATPFSSFRWIYRVKVGRKASKSSPVRRIVSFGPYIRKYLVENSHLQTYT